MSERGRALRATGEMGPMGMAAADLVMKAGIAPTDSVAAKAVLEQFKEMTKNVNELREAFVRLGQANDDLKMKGINTTDTILKETATIDALTKKIKSNEAGIGSTLEGRGGDATAASGLSSGMIRGASIGARSQLTLDRYAEAAAAATDEAIRKETILNEKDQEAAEAAKRKNAADQVTITQLEQQIQLKAEIAAREERELAVATERKNIAAGINATAREKEIQAAQYAEGTRAWEAWGAQEGRIGQANQNAKVRALDDQIAGLTLMEKKVQGLNRGLFMMSFSGFLATMAMKNLGVENKAMIKGVERIAGLFSLLSLLMQVALPLWQMTIEKQRTKIIQDNAEVLSNSRVTASRIAANAALAGGGAAGAAGGAAGAAGGLAGLAGPAGIALMIGLPLALMAGSFGYEYLKSRKSHQGAKPARNEGWRYLTDEEGVYSGNEMRYTRKGNGSGITINGPVNIMPREFNLKSMGYQLQDTYDRGG